MLLDGAPTPSAGTAAPAERPGFGLTLREAEAERFAP